MIVDPDMSCKTEIIFLCGWVCFFSHSVVSSRNLSLVYLDVYLPSIYLVYLVLSIISVFYQLLDFCSALASQTVDKCEASLLSDGQSCTTTARLLRNSYQSLHAMLQDCYTPKQQHETPQNSARQQKSKKYDNESTILKTQY